jgi:hypothetical protein
VGGTEEAAGQSVITSLSRQPIAFACLFRVNRVAIHTVGIVNSIRTKGYDPLTKRHGDGEEVGTGCAGRWGQYHFLLTAEHVIKPEAQASNLRIFWRDRGTIERRSDADLTANDIGDGPPICDRSERYHSSMQVGGFGELTVLKSPCRARIPPQITS